MNSSSTSPFSAVGLLGAALLATSYPPPRPPRTRRDEHRGLAPRSDPRQGEQRRAVGATVVATSPALQGEQVVITDENGQYFITSLPAGIYTLTVYYQDNTFSRGNVLIQVGKEAVVNVAVNTVTAAKKGETIIIKGTTPMIDQGSQKIGITITDDYTRNIPVGRTFGAVLGAAAGSQGDYYGTSIAGSTSGENTYIVEGINTTDTGFGGLSSNLPNEFIQETEVISGGYNAEYGRATGGIINVVTKSGSNEFHGSVFGYLTPGALVSAAKTVRARGRLDRERRQPRLQVRRRRRARRSDHQGQAVVPPRVQPVVDQQHDDAPRPAASRRQPGRRPGRRRQRLPDPPEDRRAAGHPGAPHQHVLLRRQDQRSDQREQPGPSSRAFGNPRKGDDTLRATATRSRRRTRSSTRAVARTTSSRSTRRSSTRARRRSTRRSATTTATSTTRRRARSAARR